MAVTKHPDATVARTNGGRANAQLVVTMPTSAARVIENLLAETGDSVGDMIRKALGLYSLAHHAHREGKAVGVASSPDSLETEFVGF